MSNIIMLISLCYMLFPIFGILVFAMIRERKHLERLAKENIELNRRILLSRGRR